MRIIAVMSPKGGIGKTTTSDAIAYMLGEEQEKRVLILDGDPQGDTSKTFEACHRFKRKRLETMCSIANAQGFQRLKMLCRS